MTRNDNSRVNLNNGVNITYNTNNPGNYISYPLYSEVLNVKGGIGNYDMEMPVSADRNRNNDQTIHYENGDVYIGNLENGKKEGYGTYKSTSGTYYEGNFKNDEKHGHGKLVNETMNLTYIGIFTL